MLNITDLKEYHKNPRRISADRFDKLGDSLTSLGDLGGIVVNKRTNEIIGGNQRVKTFLQEKDRYQIFIVNSYENPRHDGTTAEGYVIKDAGKETEQRFNFRVVDWDDEKAERANIQANKVTGEFDFSILANQFEVDKLLEYGFSKMDLDLLPKPDLSFGLGKQDDVPEIDEQTPPIAQLADVWQLGRHRLMCGDSTKKEDVEKLMNGEKAQMIFTDPPYGDLEIMKARKKNIADTGQYHEYKGHGNFNFKPVWEIIKEWDCKKIIWGGNYFADFLPITTSWIVWDKRAGKHSFFSDCKLAWTNLGKPAKVYPITWQGMIRQGESGKRVHPTQKPIELAIALLEGELILDLFGGSGSTLIACEKSNRICYMMEFDPYYCDVIIKRWEEFTGQKAEKIVA